MSLTVSRLLQHPPLLRVGFAVTPAAAELLIHIFSLGGPPWAAKLPIHALQLPRNGYVVTSTVIPRATTYHWDPMQHPPPL